MNTKRRIINAEMDVRIKRTSWLLRVLIFVLTAIVAYDAWVFQTPLFYLGFAFIGALIGRLYAVLYWVDPDMESGKLTLNKNVLAIVFSFVLIVFRFLFAEEILESLKIRRVNDAIYLLFIGLKWSKLSVIYNKVEAETIEKYRKKLSDRDE